MLRPRSGRKEETMPRPVARALLLAAAAFLIPACASVQVKPDEPHLMDSVGVFGFETGGGCVSFELDLAITQVQNGAIKAANTRVTAGNSVPLGNAVNFDLREKIKIVATVRGIVGNCPPLKEGQQYVFEDVMTRRGDGSYEADLTRFKLVSRAR